MELDVHDLLAILGKVADSLGSVVADVTLLGSLQCVLVVLNLTLTASQRQSTGQVANVGLQTQGRWLQELYSTQQHLVGGLAILHVNHNDDVTLRTRQALSGTDRLQHTSHSEQCH